MEKIILVIGIILTTLILQNEPLKKYEEQNIIENTQNTSLSVTEQNKKISVKNEIKAKKKFIKLLPPQNNQIYFGAFPDFGGSEDNVSTKRVKQFEILANKKIAWAYFSQNWFNGIKYPQKAIHEIIKAKTIPFVRLMPRSDEIQFKKENNFNLQNIINGKFDQELKQWARDAKKDFEKTNTPLLIDFAVEPNGNWFSWSGIFNGAGQLDGYGDKNYPDGPEKYRDAYRHIIDIFRSENITHITWFFHPDIYSEPNEKWNQPKYYYPGDDYIDWIGFSIYGPQNTGEDYWDTFSDILNERYQTILNISKNKPLAILEFGVTDNHHLGKKDDWLDNAFQTILKNSPLKFQAISYWHENWEEEDGSQAKIRIDSSKESLNKFQDKSKNKRFVSNLIFSNKAKNLSIPTKKLNAKNNIKENAKLLFKSGFENGVYLENPKADEGGIWWQKIQGSDVQGFTWPIFNKKYQESMLQLIVDYNKDIQKYIINEIKTTTDNTGKKTKALYQNIIKKQYGWTQNPYIIYTDNHEVPNLYIKYAMKFPKSLSADIGKDGWTVLTEFKTTTDYRLALYVYKDGDGELYWYMHGDNVVDEDYNYDEYWSKENHLIKVPLNEWFDVEIFWHRSTSKDGRVLWKINNQIVADYHGPTKIKDPINSIMVFTNYASNPHEQWIDNLEIWDTIPKKSKTILINKNIIKKNKNNWYQPKPETTWQWQLSENLNLNYNVDLYDVDLETTSKKDIEKLHEKGIKVICYFNAGAYEPYRADSEQFPKEVLGKIMEGWEDERWLDISNYQKFFNLMTARLDLAVEKKCDGIEPDNIDAYTNNTGFNLTYKNQLNYNKWLAIEAHQRNLSIALKNDLEQINDLVNYFDFAINEQCFEYNECDKLLPFIKQNKAVLGVEYELETGKFCKKANKMHFSWLKMNYDLDGDRISCLK